MRRNNTLRRLMAITLVLALALPLVGVLAQDADQPFIGVTFASDEAGARITGVLPGGPADEAGIQIGDIVTSLNGQQITSDSLAEAIAELSVGDEVDLTVTRGEETLDLTLTLASRDEALRSANLPRGPQAGQGQFGAQAGHQRGFLGISLEDTEDGVQIDEVVPGSPAEQADLRSGDIITAVNGEPVEEAQDVVDAVGALNPGDTVTLDIIRDGEELTIEATLVGGLPRVQRVPFAFGLVDGVRFTYNGADQTWTIEELDEDQPLYEAGLREGDIVTHLNGEALDPARLLGFLGSLNDLEDITVTVERDGETLDIEVPATALFRSLAPLIGEGVFDDIPFSQLFEQLPFDFALPFRGTQIGGARLGVTVTNLDEQTAQENDLTVTEGALVREVMADSPAEEAGLQVGDVVVAVDGDVVDQERTLRDRIFAYEPGDTVTLSVLRDGETLDIEVTLSEFPLGQVGRSFFGIQIPQFPAEPPALAESLPMA